jgi:hypothetical protein
LAVADKTLHDPADLGDEAARRRKRLRQFREDELRLGTQAARRLLEVFRQVLREL